MGITEGPALADTLWLSLILPAMCHSHPWRRPWLEAGVMLGTGWDCQDAGVSLCPDAAHLSTLQKLFPCKASLLLLWRQRSLPCRKWDSCCWSAGGLLLSPPVPAFSGGSRGWMYAWCLAVCASEGRAARGLHLIVEEPPPPFSVIFQIGRSQICIFLTRASLVIIGVWAL